MARITKILSFVLLTALIFIGISGCGDTMKKPTGLENKDTHTAANTIQQSDNENKAADKNDSVDSQEHTDKQDMTANNNNSNNKDTEKPASKKEEQTKQKSHHEPAVKKTNPKNSAPVKNKDDIKKKQTKKPKEHTADSATKTAPDKSKPKNDQPVSGSKKPNKPDADTKPAKKDTMLYSIDISKSENVLPPVTMEVKKGDTVLEALIRITMQKKIQMDYRGGRGATAYVEGIANVYEFDRGQGSGWMYRINGIFPNRGAGVVPLCAGDKVEWLYTTNLGHDLHADLKPFRLDGKCPKP